MFSELAGQVFDGKYRIERQLGQGGMGAVYLATHMGTTRPVALKLIAPRLLANDEFLERFRREAEAAGRLRHPNVVNVTDFGFTSAGGGRIAYLVMEYLDGESLREFLRREPAPPLDFVVDVLEQSALAVDEAHRHGIVHRDLKPDNIWLQPNGRGGVNVKVLDFGLAKLHASGAGDSALRRSVEHPDAPNTLATPVHTAATEPDASQVATHVYAAPAATADPARSISTSPAGESGGELTQAGAVLGTPAYMSPEQCAGAVAGERSDVYSLAVIAYEMLAGGLPFKGDQLALLAQHLQAEPTSLVERCPQRASAAIADLVARGMAKDPERRPATAMAFAAALRAQTVSGGQVLRRAVALYSEHFPAFLKLSLFANVPMLTVGAILLLVIPWVHVGVWQVFLFFNCMLLSVFYTFAVNRATIAVVLEQVRARPTARVDASQILSELARRVGGGEPPTTRGRLWLAARFLTYAPRSPKLLLSASIPAEVVEGLGRREANERSRRLLATLPETLRTVALFGSICYAVPTILFFLSTFGITQALGLERSAAVGASCAVAIVVMGMNVVWLIPPAHIALVALFFLAREASGESEPT